MYPHRDYLFSRDQSQASFVIATIDGKNVNHYYASDVFWLGINRELVEKMFNSIDRSFLKITIVHRYDKPETLFFIFTDFDIDKECTYQITVSEPELDMDLIEMEKSISEERLKNYPLRWEFTSKQLKKTFSDLSNYTELVTIENSAAIRRCTCISKSLTPSHTTRCINLPTRST